MSKYTADQVDGYAKWMECLKNFGAASDIAPMLRAYATLLRERENDDAIRAPWAVDRVSLCEVAHKLREIAQSDDPVSDVVSRIECHMIDWLRDSVAPPDLNEADCDVSDEQVAAAIRAFQKWIDDNSPSMINSEYMMGAMRAAIEASASAATMLPTPC